MLQKLIKRLAREAKKYIVDIDPVLLKKKYQPVKFHENIHCDINIFVYIFLEEIKKFDKSKLNFDAWSKKIKFWLENYNSYKTEYSKSDGYKYKGKKICGRKKFTCNCW